MDEKFIVDLYMVGEVFVNKMEMLLVQDGPIVISWIVFLLLICRCYYQIGAIKVTGEFHPFFFKFRVKLLGFSHLYVVTESFATDVVFFLET